MLPAVLGGSSTDSDGSAFSTLNPGDHIKKSSLVTQNNVSDRDTTRFPSDSSFGGRAILPAFDNSRLMSLAEVATAACDQYSRDFDFLNTIPSFGKPNAELDQVEGGLVNEDIPHYDHKASAKDLRGYTTIVDKAKIQAGSSTKLDGKEIKIKRLMVIRTALWSTNPTTSWGYYAYSGHENASLVE